MDKRRYKDGYDITVECKNCHLILTGHTELAIFGGFQGGTIFLSEGFCPICKHPALIATISNECYIPAKKGV